VTPSFDASGNIVGYHSNRRIPDRGVLDKIIIPFYKKLLQIEQSASSKKEALELSFQELTDVIKESGKEYNHFILTLGE
jgi:hypothetical protein